MNTQQSDTALAEAIACLPMKERRGSRPRCLLLTEGDRQSVAGRLTRLVEPFARIDPDRHIWTPRGFAEPKEARLGESLYLLTAAQRQELSNWWLAVGRANTNTPNWDIAATATIDGRQGLLLVEAKAHANELHTSGKPFQAASSLENQKRIGAAIAEANAAYAAVASGFALTRDSHYQLSNRFAWAWKLASMGVPVLLVYLAFLNADEMRDRGPPIASADEWDTVVRRHGNGIVPGDAWMTPMTFAGTPMRAIIRAVELPLPTA